MSTGPLSCNPLRTVSTSAPATPRAHPTGSRLGRAVFWAGLIVGLAGCASESKAGSTCIAPANPGGGWDFTCRAMAEAIALAEPDSTSMRTINIAGEGGGVAFARVVAEMRGDQQTVIAASPSTLLGLAQQHYGTLTERDVRWLAAVGAEPSVLAVRANAPWRTLPDLIRYWRANPDKVITGGVSVAGGQDHVKVLLLAEVAGIDLRAVRYLPLNRPAEAIDSLRSDGIQLFPGEISEIRRQFDSKEVRVLAVLGDTRGSGPLADVPTAREQGVPVSWEVWRGFYAPPGVPDEIYDRWVERLTRVAKSPEWNALLARNGLRPFLLTGREFEEFVAAETAAYRTVSQAIGVIP